MSDFDRLNDPDIKQRLREIVTRWNRTEGRIKQAERISNSVVLPAINELRYAGRRLADVLEALTATDEELQGVERKARIEYCLTEAEHNCVKASHDVIDALLFYIHGRLEALVSEFGISSVLRVFPDYVALAEVINSANALVSQSREQRLHRRDLYEQIERDHLPELLRLYAKLLVNESGAADSSIQAIETAYESKIRDRWFIRALQIGSLLFGMAGVIAALSVILL